MQVNFFAFVQECLIRAQDEEDEGQVGELDDAEGR